jgi:hypothetical protein
MVIALMMEALIRHRGALLKRMGRSVTLTKWATAYKRGRYDRDSLTKMIATFGAIVVTESTRQVIRK